MKFKLKKIIKLVIYLIILTFIIMYIFHHKKNDILKESNYYYNMIISLEKNDLKSSKFYAKKIVNKKLKKIHYDSACFFLFITYKNKKNLFFKKKINENKKSIFKIFIS